MVIAIAKIHGDHGYLDPILRTTLDGLRHPGRGETACPANRRHS